MIMKISEGIQELERHRDRKDIRLDELVDIANHLISLVVPTHSGGRVSQTLNERTVRYYIAEGLIDRPLGKEGTAALYGYRHLLQALIVKALQGAYLPIKQIRNILAEKSDRELEAILACQTLEMPGPEPGPDPLKALVAESQEMDVHIARQKALSYLDHLISSSEPNSWVDKINETWPFVRSRAELLRQSFSAYRPPGTPDRDIPIPNTWERFSLEDGIELHIRSDRLKGLRSSEIKRVLERLLTLLRTRK